MTSEEKHTSSRFSIDLRQVLGLLVSLLCFAWVFSNVDISEIAKLILAADPLYFCGAIFFTALSYVLRAIRWPFFFPEKAPNFKNSFSSLILGFFMNNVLPARLGEFVRAHLGGKATGLSRSTVLATIAGERLADGLAISLLMILGFSLGGEALEFAHLDKLYYVAYFFLFVTVFTIIALFFRERILSALKYFDTVMPGTISTYAATKAAFFLDGLTPLLNPRSVCLLGLSSGLIWSIELLVYFCVVSAFAEHLSLAGLVLFLATVNFSSLIPSAPAAAGVIELFGTLALEGIGVEREVALTMVATQHLTQILVVGVPGLFYFFTKLGGRVPSGESDVSQVESQPSDIRDVSRSRTTKILSKSFDTSGFSGEQLDISLVIPAFNEEFRLPRFLLACQGYFSSKKYSYEIIVVDDGSEDGTADLVRHSRELNSEIKLVRFESNRGKGAAVRAGMRKACGDFVLYSDADGAAPIQELERLLAHMGEDIDICIGSRALESTDVAVKSVQHRKALGRGFNALVNLLVLPGIADTQCGFKLFRGKAARGLAEVGRCDGFAFDVELLFLARKYGMRIVEAPINWTNVPGSKVNLLSDPIKMFWDLLRIRLAGLAGKYPGELSSK